MKINQPLKTAYELICPFPQKGRLIAHNYSETRQLRLSAVGAGRSGPIERTLSLLQHHYCTEVTCLSLCLGSRIPHLQPGSVGIWGDSVFSAPSATVGGSVHRSWPEESILPSLWLPHFASADL